MIANVNVLCRKFECRKDIHYKTRTSYEKYNSEVFIYIYIYTELVPTLSATASVA